MSNPPLAHKKAPEAAATAVERINPTPQGEIMTTVQQTTDIHPDIRDILAHHPNALIFEITGGDLYEEPRAEVVRLASEIADEVEVGATCHHFARFYKFDGTRVPGLALKGVPWLLRKEPNVACILEDGLVVSDGTYVAVESVEVDGAPAYRMITIEEQRRLIEAQERAEQLAFFDEHPEVTAARPSWAASVDAGPGINEPDRWHIEWEGTLSESDGGRYQVRAMRNDVFDLGEFTAGAPEATIWVGGNALEARSADGPLIARPQDLRSLAAACLDAAARWEASR